MTSDEFGATIQLHRCAHPSCPGYSYKASDTPHPNATCGAHAPAPPTVREEIAGLIGCWRNGCKTDAPCGTCRENADIARGVVAKRLRAAMTAGASLAASKEARATMMLLYVEQLLLELADDGAERMVDDVTAEQRA